MDDSAKKGAFPALGIQFHSPEWGKFSRELKARREKLRDEYENPKMSAEERLISLGKLILIRDLLGLPELEKRTALAATAGFPDDE